MIPDNHKKKAAVLAICCAGLGSYIGVGGYEGIPMFHGMAIAYRDASPREIWTYCYGETKGVTKDSRATPAECKEKLGERIGNDFIPGVEACITRAMPVEVEASFVSAAYNLGVTTFCKSSMARKWNMGDLLGACDALLLYDKSGGRVLKGLTKRREGERELCIVGVNEMRTSFVNP